MTIDQKILHCQKIPYSLSIILFLQYKNKVSFETRDRSSDVIVKKHILVKTWTCILLSFYSRNLAFFL